MTVYPDTSAAARLELEAAIESLDFGRVGEIRWFAGVCAIGDAERDWQSGSASFESYIALRREWSPVVERAEWALKNMHTPTSKGVAETVTRQIAALTDQQIERLVDTRPVVNRYVLDAAHEGVRFLRGASALREEVRSAMSARAWPPTVVSVGLAWELGELAAWAANSRLCSPPAERRRALGAEWWDAVVSE